MKAVVLLPDLYKSFAGKLKKRYAWGYLQKNHPEMDPLPVQDRLETDNLLICEVNFERSRQITKEVEERRKQNKEKRKKK